MKSHFLLATSLVALLVAAPAMTGFGDGAIDPKALEEIGREVKAFGENVKKLQDSMNTDLAAVRKLAEEAKAAGGVSPELKSQIDALSTSVAEKQAALETKVSGRMDDIEKKLNRPNLGGTPADAEERKSRMVFHKTSLAAQGQLKVGTDLSEEKVDFESIKSYEKSFQMYLRRDIGPQGADGKSMSVGSDPDGGFLVQPQISAKVLSIVFETSPMRELANVETISTDAIEYPVDDDEASCGWVGETETRSETNTPQVGVQRIPVHELYASPKATQKLLEDAGVDVEAWLARKIGDKFGRTEATAFVTGNGVKKPRGFTTYANGTTRGKIEQIPSLHATTLTADGLINLSIALKEPYLNGSTWLMKRASVGVIMLLKDGNGQYIWRPGLVAGTPSVLLGYPVRWAADMATVGAGALSVAFGNFKQGYTIVDRLGISTLRDPYTAKPFVVFYTRKRVGGDVTNFEAIKLQVVSAS